MNEDANSLHLSGFRRGDSFINQLLSKTLENYKTIGGGFETKNAYLDISQITRKIRK